jgi:hypothetical protein
MKKFFKLIILCFLILGNKGCPSEVDMFEIFDEATIYHQISSGNSPLRDLTDYKDSIPRRIVLCDRSDELNMCALGDSTITIPFVILNQTTQLCEYRRVHLPRGWITSYEVLEEIKEVLIRKDPILTQDKRACNLPQSR